MRDLSMPSADLDRQLEAFDSWHSRVGGARQEAFRRWLRSKDFDPVDAQALRALLAKRTAA